MSRNRVIGKNNRLPWRLPDELQYFRDTIRGSPIIMGRKTFEGVGKPIRDCTNIVMSKSATEFHGCIHATSLDDALRLAQSDNKKRNERVFVIGGSGVYEEALSRADRLYRTIVEAEIEGDTFFPLYDESKWACESSVHHRSDARHPYSFTMEVFSRAHS